jgi:hypothetical protein
VKKIRLIHKSGGVYYHYQFIYLYKLTNTRKRLRVEKTPLRAWNGEAKERMWQKEAPTLLACFLSSGRKWQSRHQRKEG